MLTPVPGTSYFAPCKCPAPDNMRPEDTRAHALQCAVFAQAHPEYAPTQLDRIEAHLKWLVAFFVSGPGAHR